MSVPTLNRARKRNSASDETDLRADESLSNLLVAQGGTPYAEMARAGGIWNVMSAAATPLVVFPSTLSVLEIYNNPASGMTLEVIDLMLFHLLGTAALHNLSIWAQVTAPKAAPSTASLSINSQSGRGKYTETAATRITCGAGTTVIATGWRPFGTPGSGVISTALPGEAFSVPVNGQLLVPPGCSLCITAVDALATASSVQLGAAWNERVGMVVAA